MRLRRLAYGFSSILLSVSSVFVLVSPVAHAAGNTCTWSGATDTVFETATNWACSGGGAGSAPTDGDSLVFPVDVLTGTSGVTITIAGDRSFAGITVSGTFPNSVYGEFNLSGSGTLTLTGPISITATGGAGVVFTTNVTLGADVTIDSPGTASGHANFAGAKTLALGAHNLAVTGTANMSVLGNVTGSGNINVGCYAGFLGDNSGYSGTISTTLAKASLYFSGLPALKGSIDIISGTGLFINGIDYGTNATIATPISVSGTGFDETGQGGNYHVPALTVNFMGSFSAVASVIDFSGVVLAADSSINVAARDNDTVKFSGSGLAGHTFAPEDGSQGKLIVAGQTVVAKPAIVTYADSQPTWQVTVTDNNIVIVNGERQDVTVAAGGILKGSGKVAVLTVNGGTVAPGNSPGVLNSGNVVYTSGALDEEIGGTGAGEFDQLNVTGTVDLGTATTLNVTHWNNYRPKQNDSFMIIKNDASDAITGTFQGLAEGAKVTVDGVEYTITYKGGDGNDVVLTATSVPTSATAPNTGFEMLSNNPLLTLVVTLIAVAGISYAARKQLLQNKK